jgi:formylglycine-generating enzyme required for sulfatase activity
MAYGYVRLLILVELQWKDVPMRPPINFNHVKHGNAISLTDKGGNVWQWCSDIVEASGADKIVDPSQRRVLKGGSYLCDPLVCHGYQIFGLSSSTPESSMAHIGFRCAKNIK